MTRRRHCETGNDSPNALCDRWSLTADAVRQVMTYRKRCEAGNRRHCETGHDSPQVLLNWKWLTRGLAIQEMTLGRHCETGNDQDRYRSTVRQLASSIIIHVIYSSWYAAAKVHADYHGSPNLHGKTQQDLSSGTAREVQLRQGRPNLVWISTMGKRSSLINCCRQFYWWSTLIRNYTLDISPLPWTTSSVITSYANKN